MNKTINADVTNFLMILINTRTHLTILIVNVVMCVRNTVHVEIVL